MVKKEVLKESSAVYNGVDLNILDEEKLKELKEEIQDRLDFIRANKNIRDGETYTEEEAYEIMEGWKKRS